jgi:hypothetical protein
MRSASFGNQTDSEHDELEKDLTDIETSILLSLVQTETRADGA